MVRSKVINIDSEQNIRWNFVTAATAIILKTENKI